MVGYCSLNMKIITLPLNRACRFGNSPSLLLSSRNSCSPFYCSWPSAEAAMIGAALLGFYGATQARASLPCLRSTALIPFGCSSSHKQLHDACAYWYQLAQVLRLIANDVPHNGRHHIFSSLRLAKSRWQRLTETNSCYLASFDVRYRGQSSRK